MKACRRFRPILFRVAEGEASPRQAFQVARHLSHCTACRIVLNRESRLAGLLESLADSIPVEDSFLASVMRSLPPEPPAGGTRSAASLRRGLKLAGLVLATGGFLAAAARVVNLAPGTHFALGIPSFELGDPEGFSGVLAGLARMVFAVLELVRAGLRVELPALHLGLSAGMALAVPAVFAAISLSAVVCVLARARARL
jgi:hypothetical protein